jgi:NAD(P)-dependent dehydrogenase (short-subunit alcohol dehydrogenase family)
MKVALVTGAGRGIPRALALRLAAEGWKVGLCDLVPERAAATQEEIAASGGEALGLAADIGREAEVAATVAAIVGRWGRIDLLVNAAGAYGKAFRPTHETPLEEWERVLSSNLTGYFLCAKHVLPQMMAQTSGGIVNFASNAGRSVSPLLGASYTTAKTGVIGLTRHLAHEYGRHGIRVNTIAPGPVEGERVRELVAESDAHARMQSQIPLGRLAREEDIVDVVMFLASDAARFMTGAILDVNGGYVLA